MGKMSLSKRMGKRMGLTVYQVSFERNGADLEVSLSYITGKPAFTFKFEAWRTVEHLIQRLKDEDDVGNTASICLRDGAEAVPDYHVIIRYCGVDTVTVTVNISLCLEPSTARWDRLIDSLRFKVSSV